MIKLTVALPMFRAKYIGWSALESLIAQTDIDFDWELIIAEEQERLAFGAAAVEEYRPALAALRCTLKYIPLQTWIPLSEKWRLIASAASTTSEIFVIQAADLYSQPRRLRSAVDGFATGDIDWMHSADRVFYDLLSDNMYVMSRNLFMEEGGDHPCGGDMSIRTSLVKRLPAGNKPRAVDWWLFSSCTKANGKPMNVYWDRSDGWKYSINIHGLNNISHTETLWHKKYMVSSNELISNIPPQIIQKLRDCKKYTIGWCRLDTVKHRPPTRISISPRASSTRIRASSIRGPRPIHRINRGLK